MNTNCRRGAAPADLRIALPSQRWFDYDGTMDDTPDIASIATLVGDRARATMVMGLMTGRALTATELARSANVTKQTASAHLSKLVAAGLVSGERVGRHRYFRIVDHDVATVIEDLVRLAHRLGAVQCDSGPADPALRKARVCYDHLAGELGVLVFDSLKQQGYIRAAGTAVTLTDSGARFCRDLGVAVDELERGRRPLCLACLDWSARRHHLAGALGAALLNRFVALGWARQQKATRVLTFSALGERALQARFNVR
jgi:DNA-binding transcriptional ArsR family regulator